VPRNPLHIKRNGRAHDRDDRAKARAQSSRGPEWHRQRDRHTKENHLLPEVVAAADLLVFPSRREGFGIAAIEAAAMGTPTLAARVGGLQSAVAEGVSGEFFTCGDADDLAEKMNTMLDDPEKLAALRATAREHAVAGFDKTLYDAYWLDLYRGRPVQ